MAKIIDIVLAALVVLALITVAFFAAVLLINFLEGQSPPEVAPAEDSWQRVKAAGKLVVGTAADYPPFEYYVGRELIGGFDVALMNEIGQRLGVQVEYRNYAFDKLGSGLEEGKIDAAIAAISVTPERAALMDFSDVYYVTRDAVLTYFTTPVTVNRLADLAGYRVGVQKGTIYENWLRRDLVDTGLTAPQNLVAYPEIADAITALTGRKIDFVVMDLPPASLLDRQVGLRIAGQGLNPQSFAVALPKGSSSLQAEIDRAISQLRGEGRLERLARQYLAHDALAPTGTPTPGPGAPGTAVPPVAQTAVPRPGASATPRASVTPTPTVTAGPTVTPDLDNPLAGTQWLCTSYYDPNNAGGMASVLSGTTLTAAFGTDGQVTGSAGCNSYAAGYLVNGSLLAIAPGSSTTMACDTPPGIMEQETAYLTALASAGSFAIDGNQLNILNMTEQVVLVFQRQQ